MNVEIQRENGGGTSGMGPRKRINPIGRPYIVGIESIGYIPF